MGLRRTDVTQNGFERNTSFLPAKDSGTGAGNAITFYNPNPRAAYAGNRSTKMEIARDLNIIGNDRLSRSPFLDLQRVNYLAANAANPFAGIAGVKGSLGSNNTITRENLFKPYPEFSSVATTVQQGYAWYHSPRVRVNRRFSTSLGVNGSYTWSKNIRRSHASHHHNHDLPFALRPPGKVALARWLGAYSFWGSLPSIRRKPRQSPVCPTRHHTTFLAFPQNS
jgi:hypothetical protein